MWAIRKKLARNQLDGSESAVTGAAGLRNGSRRARGRRGLNRAGAVFSLELLLVLPILLIVCFALVELSLLLVGMQRVQAASNAACRIAALPTNDTVRQQYAMSEAAEAALGTEDMVYYYDMDSGIGPYTGDPVWVEITVPMTTAAPDLLKIIGFSLDGRNLTSRTEMRKQ